MNYNQFINQEVINSNNETGIVIRFDDEHITIKYQNGEKTYNRYIAFKNKFLMFKTDFLNKEIDEDLLLKDLIDEEQKKLEQLKQEKYKNKVQKVKNCFNKYYYKEKALKNLFGSDYEYKPFADYKKRFKKYYDDKGVIFHDWASFY
jgi:hypothetical protein